MNQGSVSASRPEGSKVGSGTRSTRQPAGSSAFVSWDSVVVVHGHDFCFELLGRWLWSLCLNWNHLYPH